MMAVLLVAGWASEVWADPANTTARALLAAWKADPNMAAVAEVIASAFASGMSWAGTIEGHPVYRPPPTVALTGNQLMGILEHFVADHPELGRQELRLRAFGQLDASVPLRARFNEPLTWSLLAMRLGLRTEVGSIVASSLAIVFLLAHRAGQGSGWKPNRQRSVGSCYQLRANCSPNSPRSKAARRPPVHSSTRR